MKTKLFILFVLLTLVLSACATANAPAAKGSTGEGAAGLVVTGGSIKRSFARADLEALPPTQAAFKGITYQGVAVTALLKAAGFDPQQVKAVKAVANDGFSVNYDPSQFTRADFILAYALPGGGAMASEDGAFRMVLPDAEGKLNPRMVVELQVIQ